MSDNDGNSLAQIQDEIESGKKSLTLGLFESYLLGQAMVMRIRSEVEAKFRADKAQREGAK